MKSLLTTQLHQIVWLMDRYADQWLKEKHGISFSKFHTLITLQSIAPANQKELARCLSYSDAAVSRMVKILPEYIAVASGVGRRRILTLTPKGKVLARSCAESLEKMFCKTVANSKVSVKNYHTQTSKIRQVLLRLQTN